MYSVTRTFPEVLMIIECLPFLTGCPNHQLAAGVPELCDTTQQRPWAADLCGSGEDGTLESRDGQYCPVQEQFSNAVSTPCVSVNQRLPWLGRSPAVVEEYLSFLGNLVSAQTVYLRACLKMVVSNFKPSEFLPVCVDILITQYGYFEDVLFFLPFQREWRSVREEWTSLTRMMTMKVGVTVSLLFAMENQGCSTDSLWNGSLKYTLQ